MAPNVAELEIVRVEQAIEPEFHARVIVGRIPEGPRIRREVRSLRFLLRRTSGSCAFLFSADGAAALFSRDGVQRVQDVIEIEHRSCRYVDLHRLVAAARGHIRGLHLDIAVTGLALFPEGRRKLKPPSGSRRPSTSSVSVCSASALRALRSADPGGRAELPVGILLYARRELARRQGVAGQDRGLIEERRQGGRELGLQGVEMTASPVPVSVRSACASRACAPRSPAKAMFSPSRVACRVSPCRVAFDRTVRVNGFSTAPCVLRNGDVP